MSDKPTDQLASHEPPFKEGATSFGSFYPKNYVLAVYNNDADAATAAANLRAAGFAHDDVIVASGKEVVEHEKELKSEQGIFAKLGAQWSKLYTDESADANALVEFAKKGSPFVLVYAPEDNETTRAGDILRALHPTVLRKYGNLAITEIT
ncbi:MAG: hypothetical protein ABJC26_10360 [Gemmatimonadaceae bacterium]